MRKVDPEEGTRQSVTASASALELGAWRCSINFALELRKARIPFTDGLRLVGTHYWGYWEQDLPACGPPSPRVCRHHPSPCGSSHLNQRFWRISPRMPGRRRSPAGW